MISQFIEDLFKGNNNEHWDLGRIVAGVVIFLPMPIAEGWNMHTGGQLDLMALGGGIAAIVTACAVLIGAKDYIRNLAVSQAAQDATANRVATVDAAVPKPVVIVNSPEAPANVQEVG